MTRFAVNAWIAQLTRQGRAAPSGFYAFRAELDRVREELDVSVHGSRIEQRGAQSTPADEDLIDTTEAAEILNCSERRVRQIHNDLDGIDIGGRWIFKRQNVIDYADAKRAGQQRTERNA